MQKTEASLTKQFLWLAFSALPFTALAQDVMFRGNPEHTGVYGAVGVPKLTGVKWQFHTRGQVISSPVAAGNTVYVGSSDGNVYALM